MSKQRERGRPASVLSARTQSARTVLVVATTALVAVASTGTAVVVLTGTAAVVAPPGGLTPRPERTAALPPGSDVLVLPESVSIGLPAGSRPLSTTLSSTDAAGVTFPRAVRLPGLLVPELLPVGTPADATDGEIGGATGAAATGGDGTAAPEAPTLAAPAVPARTDRDEDDDEAPVVAPRDARVDAADDREGGKGADGASLDSSALDDDRAVKEHHIVAVSGELEQRLFELAVAEAFALDSAPDAEAVAAGRAEQARAAEAHRAAAAQRAEAAQSRHAQQARARAERASAQRASAERSSAARKAAAGRATARTKAAAGKQAGAARTSTKGRTSGPTTGGKPAAGTRGR